MTNEPPRAEAIKGAHKPFVPAEVTQRELTARALIIGSVLGLIFALSSVYLGLKVGLTVSASVPVAVLAISVFRWLRMRATILENNIVQTTGSAGESIAAGVAFTLPSLLLMGFELELVRVLLVALLGGLIGVLMMIPLRQGLIVKEHGKLVYPEGTACAEVLMVGEKGGTDAAKVFIGFFIGLAYAFGNLITKLWGDTATFMVTFGGHLKKGAIGFETTPPMLGVGYIIGPRVAANMLAGGMLAFVVLIPLIVHFGGETVAQMSPFAIRNEYILYIGAGAVATGGFIALARSIPTIVSAFRRGLGNLKSEGKGAAEVPRTERDLPMTLVLGGAAALALAIFVAPVLEINFLTAVLVVLFGFFFVTVSSRITGEIGSSSNPISGMTIATLLLTCGLFVLLGWTGVGYKAMALTTAALVCVAASNGGTISQDLKTGFLVGATPKYQQIAIMVGVITSAVLIGFTLLFLNQSATTYVAVDHVGFSTNAVTDQTESGPDGKSYRVAYLPEAHVLTPRKEIAKGLYLTDESGVATYMRDASKQWIPVSTRATLPPPEAGIAPTLAGPDGKTYAVVTVPEPIVQPAQTVPLGKYLVDEAGALKFFVDPGVSGSFPYKLEKATGTLPPAADAATELGPDHVAYKVVVLEQQQGELRPGRYLVDGAGAVAYFGRPVPKYDAPKAQLFRLIIDGTLGGNLPWGLVLIGVFIAILLELVHVSSLPFAVGLYLPIHTSAAIFIGGAVRWLVDRRRRGESTTDAEFSPGMLMASGLIAGGVIIGVIQAVILKLEVDSVLDLSSTLPTSVSGDPFWFSVWTMVPFLAMAGALYWIGTSRNKVPTAKVVERKDATD